MTYSLSDPLFRYSTLPSEPFNGIAIVGEAWGENEALMQQPFVGSSGQELTRMLDRAGIQRSACFLTNVFHLRPENNDVATLCTKRDSCVAEYDPGTLNSSAESIATGYRYTPHYHYQPLATGPSGGYVRPRYLPALARLRAELATIRPRVILALGNTAIWALCGKTGISRFRGTVAQGLDVSAPVVATYHPAGVMRQWSWRPTAIFDMMKARRVANGEWKRPARMVYVAESISDLVLPASSSIAVDIETARGLITCVGFATSPDYSLVVPFVDKTKPGYSYWTAGEEREAWRFVEAVLRSPAIKVYHNGSYDISWFLRAKLGMNSLIGDTMILHHSMYPEIEKSLRHLGSIYTDEPAWKDMRKSETSKRGDDE